MENPVDGWFGGGVDLTPYYLFEEDAVYFHQTLKDVCDKHNSGFYPDFKKQCDDYFYNSHRDESRGIGGLFFDYCRADEETSLEEWYKFTTDAGRAFITAYQPIAEKRKAEPFNPAQRYWQ